MMVSVSMSIMVYVLVLWLGRTLGRGTSGLLQESLRFRGQQQARGSAGLRAGSAWPFAAASFRGWFSGCFMLANANASFGRRIIPTNYSDADCFGLTAT